MKRKMMGEKRDSGVKIKIEAEKKRKKFGKVKCSNKQRRLKKYRYSVKLKRLSWLPQAENIDGKKLKPS